jgi:hypothetical protein
MLSTPAAERLEVGYRLELNCGPNIQNASAGNLGARHS